MSPMRVPVPRPGRQQNKLCHGIRGRAKGPLVHGKHVCFGLMHDDGHSRTVKIDRQAR